MRKFWKGGADRNPAADGNSASSAEASKPASASRRAGGQARQIAAVLALTLLTGGTALHFIYAALDTRYQQFWNLTPGSPAVPDALGASVASGDQEARLIAGQLIMAGFRGTSMRQRSVTAVAEAIQRGEVGSVLLLERNIASQRQIRELTNALQSAAKAAARPSLFIAVDQEGGEVQRLNRRNGHKAAMAPPAKKVGERCAPQEAISLYQPVACSLRAAGINVNLGPVVDLDRAGPKNPIIGARQRAYSPEAKRVTALGHAFIAAHERAGIATVVKHFPGHGSSLTDTHLGFTDITDSFDDAELKPFRALAGSTAEIQADMVMVGHLHHAAYAENGEPATFSRALLKEELRSRMGFSGVVISDDLEMGAIRNRYPLGEAAIRAVNAGVDLIILSNSSSGGLTQSARVHAALAGAIRKECAPGQEAECIPLSRAREAYDRIIALKEKLAAKWAKGDAPECVPPPEAEFEKICQGREQVAGWWRWLFW